MPNIFNVEVEGYVSYGDLENAINSYFRKRRSDRATTMARKDILQTHRQEYENLREMYLSSDELPIVKVWQ